MKKILSILLAALMIVTCFTITGCGETKAPTLKFGMGIHAAYGTSKNADGDMPGSGSVIATAAAVLVDADGKIVKCVIDTADNSVGFTAEGKINPATEYKTKGELGTAYNMAAYGNDVNGDGVVKEWFEQRDIFCGLVEGKTIDEVKALVVDGYQGTEEVMTAGCTIGVADFAMAIEKAVANAADSAATANDTLKLGIVSTLDKAKDASDEGDGSCEVAITVSAAAVNADKKAVLVNTDVLAAKFGFTADGNYTTDTTAALSTKGELGAAYNMAAYGTDLNGDGVVKEWFEQADAFDAACAGLTADEIAALVTEGYGVESLQTAGCTIAISDMVAATVKAVK